MSDFRCPYYYWDGDWCCEKSSDQKATHSDFDTYCTSEENCKNCPNYYRYVLGQCPGPPEKFRGPFFNPAR